MAFSSEIGLKYVIMKRVFYVLGLLFMLNSCDTEKAASPSEGIWLAELQVAPNEKLPFNYSRFKHTINLFSDGSAN